MTISFDEATAITPAGDGRYETNLNPSWTIGPDRPNGGYLLAVLGRAAVAGIAAQPHPMAANVQYVSSPRTGPATVDVEVLRRGRFASQARTRLVQDGHTCVDAMFTIGTLHEGSAPWWGGRELVELPPEDACRRLTTLPPGLGSDAGQPTFRDVVSTCFDPSSLSWVDASEEGTGDGETRAWFRFGDGRDPDPLSLLFIVDALPPTTFGIVRTGWVPTLNLTVYVRAVPLPGPLRIRLRASMIQDGVVDEECQVWDSGGRLVAQSTQLAGIRIPAER